MGLLCSNSLSEMNISDILYLLYFFIFNASLAVQKLADQITDTEQKHPDSVLIILGDFNKSNLSRELPKYRLHHISHQRQ